MLFNYLKNHYKEGEPIFLDDINIEGMTRPNLRQQIKTLTDNGKLIRYDKGIYYIPKQTHFNNAFGPSSEMVASYKYISREGKTNGYYSGNTFANLIGLSLQVPTKKEIVSNNSAAIVKEVTIGKQKYIIRSSNVPITEDNVKVLQFLELLKNLDSYIDLDYDEARKIIIAYLRHNHITKSAISKYIHYYPDSTFRHYYEMRLDDVLTQK